MFPDPPASNRVRRARFVLADGDGGSGTATRDIQVVPVNDNPVLALSGSVTVVENDPPVVLAPAATFGDVDSRDLATGTLTVGFAAGADAGDVLAVRNVGSGTGQISFSGGNVAFGGVIFGTTAGGTGGTALVVTFNASSTPAAVQELVRNITYASTSDNPPAGPRNVQFVVTDGDGGTSTPPQSVTVTITAVNDPPVVALPSPPITYTENNPPTAIDPAAAVLDPDSPTFSGGQLTVVFSANGAPEDTLTIINQGNGAGQVGVAGPIVSFGGVPVGTITGGTAGGALTVGFNGSATLAAVQAVTRAVAYSNTSDSPSTLTRTVRYVLTDGVGGTSTPVTTTVGVTSVNDGPTIGAVNGTTVTYPAGSAAVLVAPAGTVTDPDSANFNTGNLTVSIVAGGLPADVLAVRNQGTGAGQIGVSGTNVTFEGTVIGTVAGGTGGAPLVVTFNANATPTAAQALVDNITFRAPQRRRGRRCPDGPVPGDGRHRHAGQPGGRDRQRDQHHPAAGRLLQHRRGPGAVQERRDRGAGQRPEPRSPDPLAHRPAHGFVLLNADGSFTYTPNLNYSGTDTFTYKVPPTGVPRLPGGRSR